LSCDLGNRAAKVHVEMIDASFANQAPDCLGHVVWIGTIKLQTPGRFVRSEIRELESFVAAIDERARIDHFTDVESGAKIAANGSEGIVRHSRHRRQHHRRPDSYGSDVDRFEFA